MKEKMEKKLIAESKKLKLSLNLRSPKIKDGKINLEKLDVFDEHSENLDILEEQYKKLDSFDANFDDKSISSFNATEF